VQEVGEVGSEPGSLAASSEHPNRGPCRDHDGCPLGSFAFSAAPFACWSARGAPGFNGRSAGCVKSW
jgi:hypothetical protein